MIHQSSNLELFLSSQILKNAFNDSALFYDLNCSCFLKAQV